MNIVSLVGRLTRDVELREAANTSVGRFTLAVDRRFKREGDEQTADFIGCVAFGKTAEFIQKYFGKGNRIGINGRIQTGSYTNKDGQKVYTTEVIVENAEFVESKGNSNNGDNAATNTGLPMGIFNVEEDGESELPFN